jgi:hypothetical protein
MPSPHLARTTHEEGRREALPAPLPASADHIPEDVTSLATDLARAYQQMASFYHRQLELSGPDADRRARGLDYTPEEAAADLARIRERPPDEVSWFDLNRLVERDQDQGPEGTGLGAAHRQGAHLGQPAMGAGPLPRHPRQLAR